MLMGPFIRYNNM